MKKIGKIVVTIAVAMLVFGSFASCSKKGESAEKPAKEKNVKASKNDVLKENPESDFKYTMTDDGQGVRITKYIGKSPKIIIPATIEGLPVLEVTGLAELDHEGKKFYNEYLGRWVTPKNNVTITHISFPDSVKITYLDYGNGYYEELDLTNYDALEYIKFSPSMIFKKDDIGTWSVPLVCKCENLKTVIIPEGIKVLPIFEECKALESITLPSSIECITARTFEDCSSLKEIIIPESVTKITFDNGGVLTDETIFSGTNLNLATQAKLKQLGYKGSF